MANIFDSESPYVINGQLWVGRNGTQVPNAGLQLGPGTATPNSSPLKFTSGTNLTTPEAGAMEFDGTHLYITIGSTRYTLDQQSSTPVAPVEITGANANALNVSPVTANTNSAFNVDTSTANSATGLNIKSAAAAGGIALSTLSSGTNESMTIDAKGTGTIGLNTVGTTSGKVTIGNATSLGGLQVNGATAVTSANASSLAVGSNGATSPVLQVDSSVGSQVTGITIQGQSATFAPTITAISPSDTNLGLTISGKGTGLVQIGSGTNNVTLGGSGQFTTSQAQVAKHSTAAINATATATAAQVATGYITSTSAASTTITLPTGTLLGTQLGAVQGTVFDLWIDNTAGANTVTIAVAVNGILNALATAVSASFGLLTVPSGVTGQARFTLTFSSATAYTFARTA